MICIRLERYPSGTIKKLQARSTGPFEVLKKLESNVYAIDIPSNYGIISIFNIANLLSFKGPIVTPHDPFDEPLSSSLANLILGLKPFFFLKRHIKILLMLFWMSNLSSPRMEQFNTSWFVGEDDSSLIEHESLERSCNSSIPLF